jgi:hypothetical protein
MLKHVIKRQVLDGVVSTVDIRVRVFKGRLDNKSRRIPGLGCGGMIGTRIAALCFDPGNFTILWQKVSTLHVEVCNS